MNEKVKKSCGTLAVENEQKGDKYEKEIQIAVQKISQMAQGGQGEQITERIEEILDRVQNLAFMDGYQYAIKVLEEGLRNMK